MQVLHAMAERQGYGTHTLNIWKGDTLAGGSSGIPQVHTGVQEPAWICCLHCGHGHAGLADLAVEHIGAAWQPCHALRKPCAAYRSVSEECIARSIIVDFSR